MIRERGILFSAPMVRAILAGKKTQTRRLMKPQPTRSLPHTKPLPGGDGNWTIHHPLGWRWNPKRKDGWSAFTADERRFKFGTGLDRYCPHGLVGDRLWVRETFAPNYFGDAHRGTGGHGYKADWSSRAADLCPEPRWTPSLFMPRWASRITLEITSVRVERLQDISEEDAQAEGVDSVSVAEVPRQATLSCRDDFAQLWDGINGKRASWDSNPFVWVIAFHRVDT